MSIHLRRSLVATAIAVTAVLTFAGCSSANSASGGNEKVTLTFANADTPSTWAKAINGFEKANPNITIKQLNIPYAQYASTINQRMSQGGDGIDLLVVDAGGALIDWKNRGYLGNLTSLKADAEKAAVSKDMVTARTIDGQLYALEPGTTSQFLYFNKSLLAKAGVNFPSSDPSTPWTYEQLTSAANKVKDAGAATYPFLFDQWDTYYQLQMIGRSAGGGDGISPTGKVDFANAGWQKALTWYHDLFTSGISPRGITNDQNDALFAAGKAAFMISGPWGVGISNQAKLDYGIAPAPYFAGGSKATSTGSWGIAESSKSKNQAAAEKFIRYLVINATGNKQATEVDGLIPTNKITFAGMVKATEASDGAATENFGDILEYQLQNTAVHRPNVLGYSIFESGADQMFSDIRNGSDPLTRAKQADSDLNAQISRMK